MAKFPLFLTFQILFFGFLGLAAARPSLGPQKALSSARAEDGPPPSIFVREDEYMSQGACPAESRISAREFQDIFARDFTDEPKEKIMDPAFIKLLNKSGFKTDRLKFLGGGACGRVFRVTKGDTTYVAKIISAERSCRRQAQSGSLLKEDLVMEIGKDHPHIVQKYELLKTAATTKELKKVYGKELYIMVSEFCKRGSLKTGSGAPPRERKEVIQQIQGLWAAILQLRAHGYYHKDIKPDNIMVHKDGKWKLGDFGSASSRRIGEFFGTISSSPPEVRAAYANRKHFEKVHGSLDFDLEKTDVFAFGATIYEVFHGKPLCEGEPSLLACLHGLKHINPRMSVSEMTLYDKMLNEVVEKRADMREATQVILMLQ